MTSAERIEKYWPQIVDQLRAVAGRMRRTSDLEDVLQETYLRVLRSGMIAEGPGHLYGYAATTLRNVVLSTRIREAQFVERREGMARRRVEREALTAEQRRELELALAVLSQDQRDLMVRWAKGEKLEELSASLGIPIGTIKSRMGRARQAIRDALSTDGLRSCA